MTKPTINRISLKSIWTEFLEVLNFEKGIFYTIWQLLVAPGKAIRHFLFEDRRKMVKPFKFLIIVVAVTAIINYMFGPSEKELMEVLEQQVTAMKIEGNPIIIAEKLKDFTTKYKNLTEIFSVPLLAFFSFFIFRKQKYNFAEHLVVNAYLLAIVRILTTVVSNLAPFGETIDSLLLACVLATYFCYFLIKVFQLPFWKGIGLSLLFFFLTAQSSGIINYYIIRWIALS